MAMALSKPEQEPKDESEMSRLRDIDDAYGAMKDASFSSFDLELEHKAEVDREQQSRYPFDPRTEEWPPKLFSSQSKNDETIAILRSWLDDDSNAEEQRVQWEQIKKALDEDRLSDRKLFP